ncbi:MAG: hypothetical protein P857_114 [Candidatus Xenolissoclinum pacificiensis L6]|uniref:DUF2793 domain-containing protein n=1 Tax=Candidatus Xenolissoclinum pacificiensis L6 TaxID=1401685 RepID=W2UYM5_9RICK|nr:MAG: hypothetical protein P857_114 [Candidatus Xenolissoclinum pacificiensis L6]
MKTSHMLIDLLSVNQAQKEITVNEAFLRFDSLLNTGAENFISNLPDDPLNGTLYIVHAIIEDTADVLLHGMEKSIVYYVSGKGWNFIQPREGCMLWVIQEKGLYVFHDSSWVVLLKV